jgi:hypothetical protein
MERSEFTSSLYVSSATLSLKLYILKTESCDQNHGQPASAAEYIIGWNAHGLLAASLIAHTLLVATHGIVHLI